MALALGALAGRRVLVTGHTGFKGGWTAAWLASLGAEVTGFALAPDTQPSLFEALRLEQLVRSELGDVRDAAHVAQVVRDARPEVVLHLAAQPLVRRSYQEPASTVATNVCGTVNVLEAVRAARAPCAVIVVTSDKCYADTGARTAHTEDDRLGGADPYSASKAMTELVVHSWRASFFPVARLPEHGVALASVRAGNVVGGGDWASDRLVPDAIRAVTSGRPVTLRNPHAVRPWQHVLDPVAGYLTLAARLLEAPSATLCDAFNFGPDPTDVTVREVIDRIHAAWGLGTVTIGDPGPYEAPHLALDSTRARQRLGWRPRWDLERTVDHTVAWYRAHADGADMRAVTLAQIAEYTS